MPGEQSALLKIAKRAIRSSPFLQKERFTLLNFKKERKGNSLFFQIMSDSQEKPKREFPTLLKVRIFCLLIKRFGPCPLS